MEFAYEDAVLYKHRQKRFMQASQVKKKRFEAFACIAVSYSFPSVVAEVAKQNVKEYIWQIDFLCMYESGTAND
ncbi:unnamed protein product [Ilex paraguariensis]|uniref:Uncharacterized protein n=1 Tax=Ilex paraguariensis TaxID=185542 RepID=A0ABC8RY82_9AQUA